MLSCDGSEGLICVGRIYGECDPLCSRPLRAANKEGEPLEEEITIQPSRDIQGRVAWNVRNSSNQTYSFPDTDFKEIHIGEIVSRMMQLPKSKRVKITIIPWEE